jgi:predicted SnoaL-like aldol condensation-catalyzing enzyme
MADAAIVELNKALVTAFYEHALNERNLEVITDYVTPDYRQHNPTIEDGVEGLRKYLRWISENFPRAHSRILRVYAEGDFVILHVHRLRTPGTRGDAILDLFRVKNHRIAEHWDVIQPVPESSANSNTMFY